MATTYITPRFDDQEDPDAARKAAYENVRLIGEAFEAGTGAFEGMELVSITMADVQTVVVNVPFPEEQMPQFTFALVE
jgi:hypothetical protein